MTLVLTRLVAVLNHDFCPNLNRFVYWLKQPLAIIGFAICVSLACALCLNPQAFAAVGGLVAIVVIGMVWPTIALRGLTSTLSWERARCREGESVRARLIIKNRCPWPVWGLTLDRGFRQDAPVAALARVAAFAEVEFVWEFTPQQRGVYPLQTPLLSTGFPFGLWQARRACSVVQSLIVWPSTMPLDMLPDLTDSRVSDDRTTDRRAGDCGDLLGTRPFRQGDSLRRIHWAQSARHQRFIVTERQAGVEGSVNVVVDVAAEHHDGDSKDSSFEWTLRIAASVCECLLDGHLHVACRLGDEHFLLQGEAGLRRLLDRMAALPAGGTAVTETSGRLSLRGCDEIRTTNFQSVASEQKPMRDGLEVRRTSEDVPPFRRSQPLRESASSIRPLTNEADPQSQGSKTLFRGAKGDHKAARGTFEILCTTDLGWRSTTHRHGVHRDHRAVVLQTQQAVRADVAARSADAPSHADHECVMSLPLNAVHAGTTRTQQTQTPRPWVQIEPQDDVPSAFRQQWRRACRVA